MRIALGLAYEGTQYAGWQYQTNVASVQTVVESAIAKVAGHPVRVVCAGRTDSGVHAMGQVVHIDTSCCRLEKVWIRALNYYLPHDISILWAKCVPDHFHARFSAQSRSYQYRIYQGKLPWHRYYSWVLESLNIQAMRYASQYLIGEHDFNAFRAASCQAHSPVRSVSSLVITARSPWVMIDITANAFLQHMVRNIVGVLVDVGKGKRSADSIPFLLRSRDRRQASITAPPQGLYLFQINYPDVFALPVSADLN